MAVAQADPQVADGQHLVLRRAAGLVAVSLGDVHAAADALQRVERLLFVQRLAPRFSAHNIRHGAFMRMNRLGNHYHFHLPHLRVEVAGAQDLRAPQKAGKIWDHASLKSSERHKHRRDTRNPRLTW